MPPTLESISGVLRSVVPPTLESISGVLRSVVPPTLESTKNVGYPREKFHEELVTSVSWDPRDFLICLVMVVWKRKDVVNDGVVDFSYLLNYLRVSLLEFSSFC